MGYQLPISARICCGRTGSGERWCLIDILSNNDNTESDPEGDSQVSEIWSTRVVDSLTRTQTTSARSRQFEVSVGALGCRLNLLTGSLTKTNCHPTPRPE